MKILLLLIAIFTALFLFAPKIEPEVQAQGLNYIYPKPPAEWKPEPPKPTYKPSTVVIIKAISIHETGGGRAGVGRSRNNPVSIKCGTQYCTYATLHEGYEAGYRLWERSYAHLPLDLALARWKTGNASDRTPATLTYIAKIKASLYKSI